ncbi:unnamed protein product [Victoria cruziana]
MESFASSLHSSERGPYSAAVRSSKAVSVAVDPITETSCFELLKEEKGRLQLPFYIRMMMLYMNLPLVCFETSTG